MHWQDVRPAPAHVASTRQGTRWPDAPRPFFTQCRVWCPLCARPQSTRGLSTRGALSSSRRQCRSHVSRLTRLCQPRPQAGSCNRGDPIHLCPRTACVYRRSGAVAATPSAGGRRGSGPKGAGRLVAFVRGSLEARPTFRSWPFFVLWGFVFFTTSLFPSTWHCPHTVTSDQRASPMRAWCVQVVVGQGALRWPPVPQPGPHPVECRSRLQAKPSPRPSQVGSGNLSDFEQGVQLAHE